MTSTVSELLPCPFCGATPGLMEGHRNHWRVECPRCGVRRAQFANGGVEEDKVNAIRCWNRRSDPRIEQLEAALREAREALEAVEKTAFVGATSNDAGTKQVALESIEGITRAALSPTNEEDRPDGI